MTDMAAWARAQAACIGSVLIDESLTGQLLSQTAAEDFDGPGRTVYLAVQSAFRAGRHVDPVSLLDLVGESLREYLTQCLDVTPTAARLPEYIQTVRRLSRESRLRALALAITAAETLSDMEPLVQEASALLTETETVKTVTLTDAFLDFVQRKREGETYLPTGLSRLDAEVFLRPGSYAVLAARPSRGKTALALQLALVQARSCRVGFYSLETDTARLTDRIVSHAAGIELPHVLKGRMDQSEWKEAIDVTTRLTMPDACKLELIPAAGYTVDQIYAHAIAHRYQIVYIDYLQLIHAPVRLERYDAVTEISRTIHELSQQHGIVTVALSQLNRASTTGKSEEPGMSDIRESGQIEQDADVILMLYCQKKDDLEGPRLLKIAKNKEGASGYVRLSWDALRQTFTAVSDREPPSLPRYRKLPDKTPVPFEQTSLEDVP